MDSYLKLAVVFILGHFLNIPALSFSGIPAHAEIPERSFAMQHIGYAEGLGSERVFSIVEDSDNVIWIATKAGIDRYNGNSVKNYTLAGDYCFGDFAGRKIRLFHNDSGIYAYDNIGGIYRYSYKFDRFEPVVKLKDLIPGEIILNDIHIDERGTMWLGLGKGLYRMDAYGRVTLQIPDCYVNAIVSGSGSVYAGTSSGVLRCSDTCTGEYETLNDEMDVQSMLYDAASGTLWTGTFGEGLWSMDIVTHRARKLCPGNSIFSNPVRALSEYGPSVILVGIDGGGVYALDKSTGKETLLFNTEDGTELQLKGNGVYAVTSDYQGNIWVGGYTGGVSGAILLKYPVTVLAHENGNSASLANSNVNGVAENADGSQWFATDRGISIRSMTGSHWTHVLDSSVVLTVCRGEQGSMWAGTYGNGVYHLDSHGKIIRHLTRDDGLTTNYIFSLSIDSQRNIWVGGHEGNLLKLSPDGNPVLTAGIKWIHSICPAGEDNMAVATVNGFYMVDIVSGRFDRYSTFDEYYDTNVSAYLVSLLYNEDGTLWLGTEGGGLLLYSLKDGLIKNITVADGLPSNDVYGLQRDRSGRIWASTGKGLAIIDDFRVSNLNYIYETVHEYNKSSCTSLSDGHFIFGGTDGAVSILPEHVSVSEYQAPLHFTGVEIGYLEPEENERFKPEIYGMLKSGGIRLSYSHNSFSVTFESINYRFRRDIVYRHILEGYEKSWNVPSDDASVRYTNVAPGKYILKVRSQRRSNGEIISEKSLPITVVRPWWNSWYSWICYSSFVIALLYFIYSFKKNKLQKEYDEDKIRFFVDTAHDIRTPVTLISAPLQDLDKEESLPARARNYLDIALDGTKKLNTLISGLLEFERLDAGVRHVHLRPENVSEMMREECAAFQPYCDRKQVSLKLSMPENEIYALADHRLLEMLFDNLLSNACKYTPSGGDISLSLRHYRKKVIIEVRDTGIGIPAKEKKRIFVEVCRAENAKKSREAGTGFGLLQVNRIVKILGGKIACDSEEGKGSVFTVMLRHTEAGENVPVCSNIQQADSFAEFPQQDTVPEKTVIARAEETLLIVEDNDALRYYLGRTFEQEYNVVSVADGQAALEYLSQNYPDIILSDIMMPGIQGDDLCRAVKENPDTAGIPLILLTARTDVEAQKQGLAKGADDYIPKPFNVDILKLKVKGMLDNRRRQREYYMRQALDYVTEPDISQSMPEERDSRFVAKATGIVLDNISDCGFSIDVLCKEMAMSRTLFFGRLKSLTGKGPQEFIRAIRLKKAAEILSSGDKTVAEAAEATGFVNVKYFSILFKKEYGVQPSRYGNGGEKSLL